MAGPVVVGVSGSAASLHAVRAALDIYGPDAGYQLVVAVPDLRRDHGRATEILDDACALLGLPAERRIVVGGEPGPVLCDAAAHAGAVAVVVGARPDAAAWSHPVAAHVLRHAPCPVLLAVVPDAPRRGSSEPERLHDHGG